MSIEKKHTDGMSRRTFLQTATASAAALAGCGPADKKAPAPKPAANSSMKPVDRENPNIYDVLDRFTVYGQSGAEISKKAMMDTYGSKYTTVSVSFIGCGNDSCKLTNQNLAMLNESDNLVHFVVNLNPEFEGGLAFKNNPEEAQNARNAFEARVRSYGVKGKIVCLYPASTEDAKQIQDYIGTYTIPGSNAQLHGSEIALFAPGGNLPTSDKKDRGKWRKDGLSVGNLKEWNDVIAKGKAR